MSILLSIPYAQQKRWLELLQVELPNRHIINYWQQPELTNSHIQTEQISYAITWQHPQQDLQRYPNLRVIFSMGAGVDHLLDDVALPQIPIVRLEDPLMAEDIAMYCLYWIIDYQRQFSQYRQQQFQQTWQPLTNQRLKIKHGKKVGILGMGKIGTHIALRLKQNGLTTIGFKRTSHSLADFLKASQVLINCLPLTNETKNFIDFTLLQQLPRNSLFINVSRGKIVVDSDLLQALDSGKLKQAVLDVCRQEPLAIEHPFWQHPKIHITPHISGPTNPKRAVKIIAANLRRYEAGQALSPVVNRDRGY